MTIIERIALDVLAETRDDDAALVIERLLTELSAMRDLVASATSLAHEQAKAITRKEEQIALLREELRKLWDAPADRERDAPLADDPDGATAADS